MAVAAAQPKPFNAALKPADVIDALRNRCIWANLREALKKASLPNGTGWAELGGLVDDKLNKFLSDYFRDHIIAGERYVQVYDLPDGINAALRKKIGAATVSVSDFSKSYPLPLPASPLLSAPSVPTLVEVRPLNPNDYALVYCSVRSYDDRDRYEYDQLPKLVQQTYKGIEELITVRKVHFQAYDVAVIRLGLNRIEICIDQPTKGLGNIETVVLSVFGALCNNLPELQPAYQDQPYNVFDSIGGIYFTKSEGTVRSMSFRTLTGSRKHEKMIKSDDDLRSEKFHNAGAQAVNHQLKPYALTVDWESKAPVGKVEVGMRAMIREVSSAAPQLRGFTVTADTEPLLAVGINKVVKYI
ncbi:hypothetical protein [Paraburkholderia metrosideri]|uniref:Tle cognate immunity protein 4 C-terminal domain-containing protein n=1 Tax=Paraburkholderia metrosideri TaxID=580937 RepID=A0ABN7HXC5_9BURK|nr:hypothetical protein [Paraburkholderia metrosideri]CAD6542937.1 hypothetical protein LMG28140_03841 [Paraburkholderia metrosideri]